MTFRDRVRLLGFYVARSLRQHALASLVTAGSVALATGLVMAVFGIQSQARRAFSGGQGGFDAVLGARGSQLQLVLNAVFHLETSPGNIPWALYQAVRNDPRVSLAVPYALGDNYRGYRIVGTTTDLFERAEAKRGVAFSVRRGGRVFDPSRNEAVIGSEAARRTGLAEGGSFQPYHGLIYDEAARHEQQYVVTGVLHPTGSPADRVIWIPIDGLYRMDGHVLRGAGTEFHAQSGQVIPDEHKEVSAVMLRLASPQAGFALHQAINNQGRVATLAWPIGRVVAELFEKMGWAHRVLAMVAYLVVVVSVFSIMASITNAAHARRREFAILRALGARRWMVSGAILVEAAAVSAAGALAGYAVYATLFSVAAHIIRSQTGVVLDPWVFHPALWAVPPAVAVCGAASGLIPAAQAYSTDVARNLAPST